MKRRKLAIITMLAGLVASLSAAGILVACNGYEGQHIIPGITANAVLHIEKNRLSFVKDMEIDDADIISKCGCEITDDQGNEAKIVKQYLLDTTVKYEKFDLSTAGIGKRIAISYKKAVNYIVYDVYDYTVNFYTDEEETKLWRTVKANASFNDELDLSVWIDMNDNNYATDLTARKNDETGTATFNGWYEQDVPVAGIRMLPAPETGTERVLNLHASYISADELANMVITYDEGNRRVFSGYTGPQIEELRIPEGVTYINFTKLFASGESKFEKLYIPSTVGLLLPLSAAVNTTGLKEIVVSPDNRSARSYNGAIYSNSYETLYMMPANNENVKFHSGLKVFGNYSCAYWQLQEITLPETVTTLSHYCFAYSQLAKVNGIDKVTTIMTGVLLNCPNYPTIVHENGLYTDMYNGTYVLASVIDKTVTSFKVRDNTIGVAGDAFNGCANLITVDLGKTVKNLGEYAFVNCTSLKNITLPDTLSEMGAGVFYGCKSLEEMSVPSNIKYISSSGTQENTVPASLFRGCTSLKKVTLPSGLKRIGTSAFYGCTSLVDVEIPDTVQAIDGSAFYGCAFKNIKLPKNLTSIGNMAFSHCSKLEAIDLSVCPGLLNLSVRCFEYSGLTEVEIPERFIKVPDYCFYDCVSLKKLTMHKVESIELNAFNHCETLVEINWGDSVVTLGDGAFRNCLKLETVVLPDSVTYVGAYCFASCGLVSMTLGKGVSVFGLFPMTGNEFGTVQPALYSCKKLQRIEVAEGNENFFAVDGVLYGKAVDGRDYGPGGVLYAVPSAYQATEFTSFETVKVVLPYSVHFQTMLTKVVLNDGVENIGKGAFYSSTKLTSLSIPKTTTFIGASILLSCNKMENFEISEENTTYYSDGNCVYTYEDHALIMYMGLSPEVVIDERTKVVNMAVFMNNKVITSLVVSDSVVSVGEKAFNGCTKLKSITIGSGLKDIGDQAFASLEALEEITVSASNPYYTSKDGILYDKQLKKLVLCPANLGTEEAVIADTVTEIAEWAFAYNKTIKKVKLPTGVKSIGAYAFYECRQLVEFDACETLETVGERAFSFATMLNPSNANDTRAHDALKTVILYGNTKSIGAYAFYGQFGIENVYFYMEMTQISSMISNSGTNYIYLTKGCPSGDGTYYNEVQKCIYRETTPEIWYNDYGWFHLDSDGNKVLWDNTGVTGEEE